MFFFGATASVAVMVPSCSLACSAMSTASAPSGTGAPVMMRTASPGPTARGKTLPGVTSPVTLKASGL